MVKSKSNHAVLALKSSKLYNRKILMCPRQVVQTKLIKCNKVYTNDRTVTNKYKLMVHQFHQKSNN